jgi:hypothetical protein
LFSNRKKKSNQPSEMTTTKERSLKNKATCGPQGLGLDCSTQIVWVWEGEKIQKEKSCFGGKKKNMWFGLCGRTQTSLNLNSPFEREGNKDKGFTGESYRGTQGEKKRKESGGEVIMRIYKLRHHDICDVIYSPGPVQKYDSMFAALFIAWCLR